MEDEALLDVVSEYFANGGVALYGLEEVIVEEFEEEVYWCFDVGVGLAGRHLLGRKEGRDSWIQRHTCIAIILIDGRLREHVAVWHGVIIEHVYVVTVVIGILIGEIIIEHVVIGHIGTEGIGSIHIVTEHVCVICHACTIIHGWTEHVVIGGTLSVIIGEDIGKGI